MVNRGSTNHRINILNQLIKEIAVDKLAAVKQTQVMRTTRKKVASNLSLKLLHVGNIEKVLRKLTM